MSSELLEIRQIAQRVARRCLRGHADGAAFQEPTPASAPGGGRKLRRDNYIGAASSTRLPAEDTPHDGPSAVRAMIAVGRVPSKTIRSTSVSA